MTPEQSVLVDRIRALLADESDVREVSMFGGRSIMVNDRMIAAARKDGGLLVRVAPDRQDEFLAEPGASQAEMGSGRKMGPGWIAVSADALRDDEALARWIEIVMSHNREVSGM